MQKYFIFINKTTDKVALYGSLKSLFDAESEFIKKAKQTFYNSINLELEDYEDENCRICKRSLIRSQHSQIL